MSQPLESYRPIVKPLFDLVSIDSPAEFATSRSRVSHASLTLFAAHFSLSEIWNGGLLQFFFNSTGLLAPEAIEGFKAIGMPSLAVRLSEAASSLGESFLRDRRARWDAMLVNSGFDEDQHKGIFDKSKHQTCHSRPRRQDSTGID